MARCRDLLVEVNHVRGAAPETLDQSQGPLCMELLQKALHLDCGHGAIMRFGTPPLIGDRPLTATLNRGLGLVPQQRRTTRKRRAAVVPLAPTSSVARTVNR
jgi:hypothetical protein